MVVLDIAGVDIYIAVASSSWDGTVRDCAGFPPPPSGEGWSSAACRVFRAGPDAFIRVGSMTEPSLMVAHYVYVVQDRSETPRNVLPRRREMGSALIADPDFECSLSTVC